MSSYASESASALPSARAFLASGGRFLVNPNGRLEAVPNVQRCFALNRALDLVTRLPRPILERFVSAAIEHMDTIDGDPDLEEDDPSGDPLDLGEYDEAPRLPAPRYGVDQSLGPINHDEAVRQHMRAERRAADEREQARLAARRINARH